MTQDRVTKYQIPFVYFRFSVMCYKDYGLGYYDLVL